MAWDQVSLLLQTKPPPPSFSVAPPHKLYALTDTHPHAFSYDRYPIEERRFKVLAAIAFAGAAGMMQWLSTAPGSDTLADYFSVASLTFQIANVAFFAGSIVGILVALYLLSQTPGIRYLALLGSGLIFSGALVRIFSFDQGVAGFVVLCVGNVVSSISAGVLILMPTHVSLIWFPPSEQTTATGLTLGGVGVGAVLGYVAGALMTQDSSDVGMWVGLNGILLGLALIGLVLVFVLVDDAPLRPPNAAVGHERRITTFAHFNSDVQHYTHVWFWIFVVQLTLAISVYFTLQTTLQTALNDRGYSRFDQNITGILFQVVGLVGTIGFSYLVDHFNFLKIGTLVAWWLAMGMFVLFLLRVVTTILGTAIWSLYLISALSGLVFSAVPPLALQLACNTVFPIPPALVSVCLFLLAQVATIVVLLSTRAVDSDTTWYIMAGILGASAILSITNFKLPLRKDIVQALGKDVQTSDVPV
jgi:MFS family permease